jgi:hypothetical protein
VLENDLAVALVVLIEHNTEFRPVYQLSQLALAVLNRRTAQILAV